MKSFWSKWITPPWPWQIVLLILLAAGTTGFYIGIWQKTGFAVGNDSPISLEVLVGFLTVVVATVAVILDMLYRRSVATADAEEQKTRKRQELSQAVFAYLFASRAAHLQQCAEMIEWAELYSSTRGPDKSAPPIPNRDIIASIQFRLHGSSVKAGAVNFPHRPDHVNDVFKHRWAFRKAQIKSLELIEDSTGYTELIQHLAIEIASLDDSTNWQQLEDFFRTLMNSIDSCYRRCKLYDNAVEQWREDGAVLPSQRRKARMAKLSTTEIFTRITSIKQSAHQFGIYL